MSSAVSFKSIVKYCCHGLSQPQLHNLFSKVIERTESYWKKVWLMSS